MISRKEFISILILLLAPYAVLAQNGVNSPYSRYGFGQLCGPGFGSSSAMGGVAYGLRDGKQINVANPASYSACDSLTFLFDAGMSLQNGNFNNGTTRMNVRNASFDYVMMQFRAFKNIGVSFGFIPFSKIGYSFGQTGQSIEDEYESVTSYMNYQGDGGLSQAYIGVGAKVYKGLSVGMNFSYLFGDVNHTVTNSYSSASVFQRGLYYNSSISSYKLDFGLQYELQLNATDQLTVGLTYNHGHNVNCDAHRTDELYRYAASSSGSTTKVTESYTVDTLKNAFQLPHGFGVGLSYRKGTRWLVAADYSMQKWSSVKYPMTEGGSFASRTGYLSDRHRISVGAEFVPNAMSRKYLNRVKYRLGGYYATPYTKINGEDGAKEYGLSAGFGFPINNVWNGRSVVNISAQWIHVEPGVSQLLKENYLRLNIGITFNERWFMKWKVD